eukprot:c45750_g1_i1.p1 GENE.c45750_g1_i1~~c45750_g1_i1.p1  ORF type:complete len:127 (+),score=19.25 c45750_g1_i1:35-415(+)
MLRSRLLAQRYEVTCILTTKLPATQVKDAVKHCATQFLKNKGVIYDIVNRGEMNLAYTFKHQKQLHDRGQFMVWDIEANATLLDKFVTSLKYDTTVLRYLVLRNDEVRPLFKPPVAKNRRLPRSHF